MGLAGAELPINQYAIGLDRCHRATYRKRTRDEPLQPYNTRTARSRRSARAEQEEFDRRAIAAGNVIVRACAVQLLG
jgi:hypothetical protein